jgi:hypothetical protein
VDVCFWHKADIQLLPGNIHFSGKSGHHSVSAECLKLTILFVVVVGAILVWWLRSVKPPLIHLVKLAAMSRLALLTVDFDNHQSLCLSYTVIFGMCVPL